MVFHRRADGTLTSFARRLAEMVRVGWFKAVQVKSLKAHERKALLIARHQLVEMRVQIDNHLRGILKTFGLVIANVVMARSDSGRRNWFSGIRVLMGLLPPWWRYRDSLLKQIAVFDRSIGRLAKTDDTARRLIDDGSGVGPVVALAYMSAIDEPGRFDHARDDRTACACRASRQTSGRPSANNACVSHTEVGPLSGPTRTTLDARLRIRRLIALGSDATLPSKTTVPIWFRIQTLVLERDVQSDEGFHSYSPWLKTKINSTQLVEPTRLVHVGEIDGGGLGQGASDDSDSSEGRGGVHQLRTPARDPSKVVGMAPMLEGANAMHDGQFHAMLCCGEATRR